MRAALRRRLDEIGDSVVVSTAWDLTNVHVHTDDIGAALEAGLLHAAPQRVAVTLLETVDRAPRAGVSIVACAAGPGIARVLEAAGAVTVPSGPGRRASAGEIVAAVREAAKGMQLDDVRVEVNHNGDGTFTRLITLYGDLTDDEVETLRAAGASSTVDGYVDKGDIATTVETASLERRRRWKAEPATIPDGLVRLSVGIDTDGTLSRWLMRPCV